MGFLISQCLGGGKINMKDLLQIMVWLKLIFVEIYECLNLNALVFLSNKIQNFVSDCIFTQNLVSFHSFHAT